MHAGDQILSEDRPRLLASNATDLEPFGLIKVGVLYAPHGEFLQGALGVGGATTADGSELVCCRCAFTALCCCAVHLTPLAPAPSLPVLASPRAQPLVICALPHSILGSGLHRHEYRTAAEEEGGVEVALVDVQGEDEGCEEDLEGDREERGG